MPQGARGGDTDPEYLDQGPGRKWATAIAAELPRVIDARYRTIASRQGRALIGLSAGGYGAMHLALDHLATFSVVESWSGYFHPTDPTGLKGSTSARQDNDRANVHAQRSASAADAPLAADADRVLRREERHAVRGRERAAEPGALARRHRPCLPSLRRRPRPAAVERYAPAWLALAVVASRPRPVAGSTMRAMATTAKQTALDPRDFLAIDALLDDEERAIRDTVRQFVRDRIVPDVGEWFEQGILPRELVKESRGSASSACISRATASPVRAPSRTG